jgi:hypothetical protein
MTTWTRPERMLATLYRDFPLRPRRTRLYCVGMAKSGTHSIAVMFADRLRSGHEPEAGRTIELILALAEGQVSREEFRRSIVERDRRLRLEVDSSALNFFLLDALVPLFPDARFLLTVRHPRSWLDSFINHQLAHPTTTPQWARFREFRFRPHELTHPPEEAVLKSRGLYTLDAYLAYWASQTRAVLEKVPADRLLVVRTDQITARAADIARFAGLPPALAAAQKSRANPAKAKFGILSELDADYVDAKIREHGGELVDRLFVDSAAPRESRSEERRPSAERSPVLETRTQ